MPGQITVQNVAMIHTVCTSPPFQCFSSFWCRIYMCYISQFPASGVFLRQSLGIMKIQKTPITFFTFSTWTVPGFSQRGTAVRFQGSSIDVDLTAIVDHLQPAGALTRLCFRKENLVVNTNTLTCRGEKKCTFHLKNICGYGVEIKLLLVYQCTPVQCCPRCCPLNTNTRRTPGCWRSLRWYTGKSHTHWHLWAQTVIPYRTEKEKIYMQRCTAPGIEHWSNLRRHWFRYQSDILSDTDRWNSRECSCTGRCHRAACSCSTRQYLKDKSKTNTRHQFFYSGLLLAQVYWSSPTNTVFARVVHLKAGIAVAFERPQHVLTDSILTDIRVQGTFVYIWEGKEQPAEHVREDDQITTHFQLKQHCLSDMQLFAIFFNRDNS